MLKSHSLPVTKSRLEEWRYSQIEWIQHLVLQHLWQDTFEFLELLQKNNISIAQLVWKPNSVDPKVLQKIKLQLNIPVSVRDYDVLDNTQYLIDYLKKQKRIYVLSWKFDDIIYSHYWDKIKRNWIIYCE